MISIYYKSGDAQWRYELEDSEYAEIIKNVMEDAPDVEEMFDDSLEILGDVSALSEDEMDEEDQIDQTIAVAFLWHYFNHLTPEGERIEGDVVLIEDEDGTGVTVLPASELVEEDEE